MVLPEQDAQHDSTSESEAEGHVDLQRGDAFYNDFYRKGGWQYKFFAFLTNKICDVFRRIMPLTKARLGPTASSFLSTNLRIMDSGSLVCSRRG